MELQNRGEFHKLLNSKNLKGKFVEIGVARGEFSKYLLSTTLVEKMYLVDPYKNFDIQEYTDAMNRYNMDNELNICKNNLSEYTDRIEFIRKTSFEAHTIFEDSSLDFVYIDGNHCYKNVMEDLECYWPKVKNGGILAGDDVFYTDKKEDFKYWDNVMDINKSHSFGLYGVYQAVIDFCQKYNLIPYFFSTQFYILK